MSATGVNEPLAVREAPASYVLEAQRVRPGYKQTDPSTGSGRGNGVIQVDWDERPFGSLYLEPSRNGIYKTAEFQGRGIRIVNMGEMFGYEFISNQDMNRVALSKKELLASALHDGDLLFGRRSIVPAGAGKCSLVIAPQEPITFESSIIRVRLNQEEAYPPFFYYFFASAAGRSVMSSIVSGTNVKGIRASELRELEVPLPTKAEQEAIAEALSDADVLIEALEQLITKKRHLKQGAMQELLTGKKRLPGFSGEWEVRTIEQLEKARLLQLSRGNVISKVDIECVPGDFPIYSSSVKSDGVFGNYGEYMFDEELITWSIDGGGHFFHRPRHKFSVTNVCGYMRADTSKFSFQFLAAQLQLLHSKLKFDYQDKAHPSVIRKAYLVFIPTLDEQTAIATILSDMDTEIAALETRLSKTRSLKQGMMHNLLTGRIRLQ